jgi:hypothetical protein
VWREVPESPLPREGRESQNLLGAVLVAPGWSTGMGGRFEGMRACDWSSGKRLFGENSVDFEVSGGRQAPSLMKNTTQQTVFLVIVVGGDASPELRIRRCGWPEGPWPPFGPRMVMQHPSNDVHQEVNGQGRGGNQGAAQESQHSEHLAAVPGVSEAHQRPESPADRDAAYYSVIRAKVSPCFTGCKRIPAGNGGNAVISGRLGSALKVGSLTTLLHSPTNPRPGQASRG